ncbi:MAG TPA: hypothetical protein VJ779_22800, partial [Acetobacteraceae bacterium]|nr:hypothetical protein [Acetobacteraceae bacterium]
RIVAIEAKGNQLAGNPDTNYKRALFELLSEAFAREQRTPAGTLQLVQTNGVTVECRMMLIDSWRAELPGLLTA